MMIRRVSPVLLLLSLAAGGCASSGRSGTPLYRRDIGTASGPDATTIAMRVVHQYSYEVFSVDSIPEIRIVTHWRPRRVFEDELGLGVTDAESRLVIVARQRGQTEMGAFYAVNLAVENRLRTPASPEWNETTNTPLFLKYADEIANEYRRQITNIGVRRY